MVVWAWAWAWVWLRVRVGVRVWLGVRLRVSEEAVRHHVISVDLERVIRRVLARGEVAHLRRCRLCTCCARTTDGSATGYLVITHSRAPPWPGVRVRARVRLRLSCPRVGLG